MNTPSLAVWLGSCMVVLAAIGDPLTALLVGLSAVAVAGTVKGRSPLRSFLTVAIVAVGIRTALFGLTGHSGETILFILPALDLPSLAGGGSLGGPVTAEALATGVAEGARLIALMACFAAFLSAASSIDLLRLVPRFMFEAGLAVNIAVAYAPQLLRTARSIRDAQVCRGDSRKVRGVMLPTLSTALERSVSLAESMDSRGYGSAPGAPSGEARWRGWAAASSLALASSASLWAMGKAPIMTAGAATAAAVVLVISLRNLSALVPRTKYRPKRWSRADALVAGISILSATLAIVLKSQGAIEHFDAYPILQLPSPAFGSTFAAALLCAPAIATLWGRR